MKRPSVGGGERVTTLFVPWATGGATPAERQVGNGLGGVIHTSPLLQLRGVAAIRRRPTAMTFSMEELNLPNFVPCNKWSS